MLYEVITAALADGLWHRLPRHRGKALAGKVVRRRGGEQIEIRQPQGVRLGCYGRQQLPGQPLIIV